MRVPHSRWSSRTLTLHHQVLQDAPQGRVTGDATDAVAERTERQILAPGVDPRYSIGQVRDENPILRSGIKEVATMRRRRRHCLLPECPGGKNGERGEKSESGLCSFAPVWL